MIFSAFFLSSILKCTVAFTVQMQRLRTVSPCHLTSLKQTQQTQTTLASTEALSPHQKLLIFYGCRTKTYVISYKTKHIAFTLTRNCKRRKRFVQESAYPYKENFSNQEKFLVQQKLTCHHVHSISSFNGNLNAPVRMLVLVSPKT